MSLRYVFTTRKDAEQMQNAIAQRMGYPRIGVRASDGTPQPDNQQTTHWDMPRQRQDTGEWYIIRPREKHLPAETIQEIDLSTGARVMTAPSHWHLQDWHHAYVYAKDTPMQRIRETIEENEAELRISNPAYPQKDNGDGTYTRLKNLLFMNRTDAVYHVAARGPLGQAFLDRLRQSTDITVHERRHIDFIAGRYPDHMVGNNIPFVVGSNVTPGIDD